MAKRIAEKKTFECYHCGTEHNTGTSSCWKCGFAFPCAADFDFDVSYASEAVRDVIKKFESEHDGPASEILAQINALLKEGEGLSEDKKYSYSVDAGTQEVISVNAEGEIVRRTEGIKKTATRTVKADYERSFDKFKNAAELGSIEGLRRLGHRYVIGVGVEENVLDGFILLCKAASCGDEISIGYLLEGRGKIDSIKKWNSIPNGEAVLKRIVGTMKLNWPKYTLAIINSGNSSIDRFETLDGVARDKYFPSPGANMFLCLAYFCGLYGCRQDIDKALSYLRRIPTRDKCRQRWMGRALFPLLDLWDEKRKLELGANFHYLYGAYWPELHNDSAVDRDQLCALLREAAATYKKEHNVSWINFITSDNWPLIKKEVFDGHERSWSIWRTTGLPFIGRIAPRKTKGVVLGFEGIDGNICNKEGELFHCAISYGRIEEFLFEDPRALFYKKGGEGACYNFDFKACGMTQGEMEDFLNYVRRFVLLDRKPGVKLLDGRFQEEVQNQNADGTWKRECADPLAGRNEVVVRSAEENGDRHEKKRELSKEDIKLNRKLSLRFFSCWLKFIFFRSQASYNGFGDLYRNGNFKDSRLSRLAVEKCCWFVRAFSNLVFRVCVCAGAFVAWSGSLSEGQMRPKNVLLLFGLYGVVSYFVKAKTALSKTLLILVLSAMASPVLAETDVSGYGGWIVKGGLLLLGAYLLLPYVIPSSVVRKDGILLFVKSSVSIVCLGMLSWGDKSGVCAHFALMLMGTLYFIHVLLPSMVGGSILYIVFGGALGFLSVPVPEQVMMFGIFSRYATLLLTAWSVWRLRKLWSEELCCYNRLSLLNTLSGVLFLAIGYLILWVKMDNVFQVYTHLREFLG